MKIVMLDGSAVNPGDLSWDKLEALSKDIHIYDHTDESNLKERMQGCEILITNKVPITKEVIADCPTLKCICVEATGYNNIDVAFAKEKGIPVCNIPAYSTASVAQHTIALLLEITNGVGENNLSVQNGDWCKARMFTYNVTPQIELDKKTIGIVGFGNIGSRVAAIAHSIGMQVLSYNPGKRESDMAEFVDLDTLYQRSDVITLHCPLTADNREMINRDSISKMKDGVIFLNAARGGLVNEADLVDALNRGKIYAAGLDVVTHEPMKKDSALLTAKHLYITPHVSWASKEARERLINILVQNVKDFIDGHPGNVVNK